MLTHYHHHHHTPKTLSAGHVFSTELETSLMLPKFWVPTQSQPKLILTPISANTKKKGHIDFQEQERRILRGETLMWDDSYTNSAHVGDLFGFWMCNTRVRVHYIEKISPPNERLPSWSDNVGQSARNVVFLSKKSIEIPWDAWIGMNGAIGLRGTSNALKGMENIFSYLSQR